MSFALYATIWLALALFVAGEAGKRRRPVPGRAWWLSLAGAMMCAVHIVIAMGHHHHWSHASAIEETARQTASVYGVAWGGGVYVNYLFVAVWLGYLWRWWTPAAGATQSAAVVWGLRAFFFMIIFNATVVFAVSRMRTVGIVLSLALALIWAFQSPITNHNQQSPINNHQSQESLSTTAGSMRDAR
jgi:hypothetical protein